MAASSKQERFSLLIDGAIVATHATGGTTPATAARAAATSLLKLATA